MEKLWPILMVIAANTVYNICAKQTPDGVDPFFSLVVTYGVAMLASLALFLVASPDKNVAHAFQKLDWTSYVFGLSIVGLEFGYLHIYRAGWQVSTASLVANISLAVVLLVVGLLAYHESLTIKQAVGIVVCGVGLMLITA